MAYAVSYPGGVFGIIVAILMLRWMFRVNPAAEAEALEQQLRLETPALINLHVKVTNSNLYGVAIARIPAIDTLGVVVSRVMRGSDEMVAGADLSLAAGDIVRVVGEPDKVHQFAQIVGEQISIDVSSTHSQIQVQWITVSRKHVAEQTIEELALSERYDVQLTRVRRSGIELPPMRNVRLHLGDEIRVVGLLEGIARVVVELGDSPRRLGEPDLLPIFLGITLGVIVGSIPFTLPGLHGSVKLGLAGGPLLVAIVLSRIQRIGPIVWYLPRSANLALRDIGIAIFLASVGLKSGDLIVDTFVNGSGLQWLAVGAVITFVPLLIVGLIAHLIAKENYLTIIGMLAGSMTDPPALAFANSLAGSEIPSLSYATVYPLTMILRILSAQLLMIYWAG